jgi:hypothetical protein
MGELQKLFHEMEERAAYGGFTFKEILMSRNPVLDPTNPTKVLGLTWDMAVDWLQMHCNPSEAYMRLITASCEAGPGAFEICMRRILILDLLTDVPFETLHSASESGICTLN